MSDEKEVLSGNNLEKLIDDIINSESYNKYNHYFFNRNNDVVRITNFLKKNNISQFKKGFQLYNLQILISSSIMITFGQLYRKVRDKEFKSTDYLLLECLDELESLLLIVQQSLLTYTHSQ
jgi:hypothetical protein